jgi:Fe-Mn family superoxide dismutase
MKHELPKLSYSFDALEPEIDAKTMEIHHDKHHQAYIDNLNKALEKYPDLQGKKVEELLADNLKIVPEDIKSAVRNHGGGHVNHSLFWEIMTPDKKKREFNGKIADVIVKDFGSFDKFKELMSDAGMKRFGSGWAWLVLNKGKLEIYSTANQDSPLMEGKIPILGIDVWEHSYYLKWNSNRKGYLDNIFNIINWKKVDELYAAAVKNK